jgi:hypothetical protein
MRTPLPGQLEPMRPIGAQLFVDWRHVDGGSVKWTADGSSLGLWDPAPADALAVQRSARGIRLEVQPAQTEEMDFECDRPWERGYMMYVSTVLHEEDKYRMWYVCTPPDYFDGDVRWPIGTGLLLCYAESADGLKWTKPALGVTAYYDQPETNIVYGRDLSPNGFSSGSVFRDPSAVPEERYKLFYKGEVRGPDLDALRRQYAERWGDDLDPNAFRGKAISFIAGAVSPDGIHWTPIPEPLLIHHSDQLNNASWDSNARKYVGYFRSWRYGRRCVARAETANFRHWPVTPTPILDTPLDWHPAIDVYTSPVSTYPGSDVQLMFPDVYNRFTDNRESYLASSEDGAAWHWVPGGAIVQRHAPGAWSGGDLIIGQGLVELPGNRIGAPMVGYAVPHKYPRQLGKPLGTPGWATWSAGRLSAVVADEIGEFATLGLVFDASRLTLNYSTEMAGGIAVELRDEKGRPLDGYRFADFDEGTGDKLAATSSWKGSTDISSLAGATIKVAFRLRSARLYSFEFVT